MAGSEARRATFPLHRILGPGHVLVFDRSAADIAASVRVIDYDVDANPLLVGDRVFLATSIRAQLMDLTTDPPELLKTALHGVGYGHRVENVAGIAVPTLSNHEGSAFELDVSLTEYSIARRDCAYDLTPVEEGEAITVVPGSAERLPFGAAVACPEPTATFYGISVEPRPVGPADPSKPSGARLAVYRDGVIEVLGPGGETLATHSVPEPASILTWTHAGLVLGRLFYGDAGGGSLNLEVVNPLAPTPGTPIQAPAPLLSWSEDETAVWGLSWGKRSPSDEGPVPDPSHRVLWRFDPAASPPTITVLALREDAAPASIATAPGLAYLAHLDGRVWRIDETGAILAEAAFPVPLAVGGLLAVPGLGIFGRDQLGRPVWFTEDLGTLRTGGACTDLRLADSLETPGGTLLVGSGPVASYGSSTAAFVVKAVVDTEERFHLETVARLPSLRSGGGVTAGNGLWLVGGGYVELLLDLPSR